jgi:hypothetical protein
MILHLFHKIRFAVLKRRIEKNHCLGKENVDGSYDYKQGSYDIRYRIIKQISGEESIEWISQRRRLTPSEQGKRRIGKSLFNFWHYQGWLIFFRPPIIFLLLISILIFYFGLMETQETKTNRLKVIVATAIGISSNEIQYIGDGWLEISAKRKRKQDGINEPIRYSFNPLRWLFFAESGGVFTRWRGEPFGYATHPVVVNEKGDVWLIKEDTWVHGQASGEIIKWDTPVGSARVSVQELSREDKKLRIIDK